MDVTNYWTGKALIVVSDTVEPTSKVTTSRSRSVCYTKITVVRLCWNIQTRASNIFGPTQPLFFSYNGNQTISKSLAYSGWRPTCSSVWRSLHASPLSQLAAQRMGLGSPPPRHQRSGGPVGRDTMYAYVPLYTNKLAGSHSARDGRLILPCIAVKFPKIPDSTTKTRFFS